MGEENPRMSSQENLPLSQEMFVMSLLNQLDCPITRDWTYDIGMEAPRAQEFSSMVAATEFPNTQEHTPVEHLADSFASIQVPNIYQPDTAGQKYIPSSLPSSVTWPGKYSFNVFFNEKENSKNSSWVYSALQNKLYVGKNIPCPISFSTSVRMTDDVCIRAMCLFSSSENAADVVRRCVNHSMDEINRGIFEAEHLIRCESSRALYEEDKIVKRHSVVVPFENPSAGQNFSTYIYKFTCFGSCSGGPNRRPLMLVFTLEKGSEIIGRYKMDLRICACPERDKSNDEKQLFPSPANVMPVKRKEPPTSTVQHVPCKKVKKPYVVKAHDRKCYEFLLQMRKYYHICEDLKKKISPFEWKQFIYSSLSSSEDEVPDN